MAGIEPILPLYIDFADGAYASHKELKSTVQQNLKNLCLTSPGERIMIPTFGVGLRNYFFQNKNQLTYNNIAVKIREQVGFYMSYLDIVDLQVDDGGSEHGVSVKIVYFIKPLSEQDILNLDLTVSHKY